MIDKKFGKVLVCCQNTSFSNFSRGRENQRKLVSINEKKAGPFFQNMPEFPSTHPFSRTSAFFSRTFCIFFPRTSERRVLLIVEVCHHILSSSHLLIFKSFHIFSSSHLLTSAHICSSSHIFTSSRISSSHIFSHLLIFKSSHIFSSSHLLTSSPLLTSSLSCLLALLPSCPLLFPSFLFLS